MTLQCKIYDKEKRFKRLEEFYFKIAKSPLKPEPKDCTKFLEGLLAKLIPLKGYISEKHHTEDPRMDTVRMVVEHVIWGLEQELKHQNSPATPGFNEFYDLHQHYFKG